MGRRAADTKKKLLEGELVQLARESERLALEEFWLQSEAASLAEEAELAQRLALLVEPNWAGAESNSASEVLADLIESKNALGDASSDRQQADGHAREVQTALEQIDRISLFITEYATSTGWNTAVTEGEIVGVEPPGQLPPVDLASPRAWKVGVAAFVWASSGNGTDHSDRVVVLDYGRKIADGSPDEVRANQDVIDAYLGVAHE